MTPRDQGGIGPIRFPLAADLKKQISRDYGVLFDDEVALRGPFLIDREGRVCHATINDLPLGRSVDEAMRVLDALQHHEAPAAPREVAAGVAVPGDAVIG